MKQEKENLFFPSEIKMYRKRHLQFLQRLCRYRRGTFSYELRLEGLKGIQLWELEHPQLYEVEVSVLLNSRKDSFCENFGFRSAEFRTDGFFLNGKHINLIGLNRHQSFPYNGYAMPAVCREKMLKL